MPQIPENPNFILKWLNYFRPRVGESRFFEKRRIFLLLGALLYTLSPIDLIPDFLIPPGIGQIDDTAVIIFTVLAFLLPCINPEAELPQKDEEETDNDR
ncbi:MAG: YkvA family protein [Akkermansia sp.]|nr:YkvA family protein [Akkermansia sp.]